MSALHATTRRGRRTMTRPVTPGPRWTAVVSFVCAVALAVLTGCGSNGSSNGNGSTGGAATAAAGSGTDASSAEVITIQDFMFSTPASVSAGATVTVDNKDGTAHTVTADDGGGFDVPASAGKTTFTAPSQPGTYPFHCSIHPEMHGTLTVK